MMLILQYDSFSSVAVVEEICLSLLTIDSKDYP